MEDSEKYPRKLAFGQVVYGKSMPLWIYDSVPDGMRRITDVRELWKGRQFLFEMRSSPGMYMTSYFRPSDAAAMSSMLSQGLAVYVKD